MTCTFPPDPSPRAPDRAGSKVSTELRPYRGGVHVRGFSGGLWCFSFSRALLPPTSFCSDTDYRENISSASAWPRSSHFYVSWPAALSVQLKGDEQFTEKTKCPPRTWRGSFISGCVNGRFFSLQGRKVRFDIILS